MIRVLALLALMSAIPVSAQSGVDWVAVDSVFVSRAPTPDRPDLPAEAFSVPIADPTMLFVPGDVVLPDPTPEGWSALIAFRDRHPAIARGLHERLDAAGYAFYRGLRLDRDSTDEVVIVAGASGATRIKVASVFPDDTVVREVLTGQITMVSYGEVSFEADDSGMLLIEVVQ
ncbi:MAG: hypothetical protein JJ896_00970 [Rhodothermales bacterium]|nr:hypothetical protein [Rhodothermales bacterium]MBO6778199.1 hypothetical protein [Rhodothermales bacterium]